MVKAMKIKEKFKNKRNAKARLNVPVKVDDSEVKKIKVDLDASNSVQFDSCNALVLPSKKRKTKKVLEDKPIKILSKKHRKRLMKVKQSKEKREAQSGILKELESLHASEKRLTSLLSLQETQTLGRKRYKEEQFDPEKHSYNKSAPVETKILGRNHISSLVKKRKREDAEKEANMKKKKGFKDPRVVDPNDSSSSSDYSSSDESDNEDETVVVEKGDCKSAPTLDVDMIEKAPIERTDLANEDTKIATVINVEDKLPSTFVKVKRSADIEKTRQSLPVVAEEQTIMEAIRDNMMTVIVGPTGSGKTTQVPQFLYEAGYARGGKMIGVTEPRQVAAISMSARVGEELGLTPGEVSYQIRLRKNVTKDTRIKFMTDGVLLKEMQSDKWLSKYSVLIIDEAHERSVFSDIMIGLLSRLVPKRHERGDPLKLIVMSATLNAKEFVNNAKLVKKMNSAPPLIQVEGRTFPVTNHFNDKTDSNYVNAAFKKVCQIHKDLPEGGILVFLTGAKEVEELCERLRQSFPSIQTNKDEVVETETNFRRLTNLKKEMRHKIKEKMREQKKNSSGEDVRSLKEQLKTLKKELVSLKEQPSDKKSSALKGLKVQVEGMKRQLKVKQMTETKEESKKNNSSSLTHKLLDVDVSQFANVCSNIDTELDVSMDDDSQDIIEEDIAEKAPQPLHVLPLYSQLNPEKQKLVFQPPPPGTRLVVVSTNVAETSLTIPEVKYVVDSGKTKEKVFDKVTGVSMFMVTNISKASAQQRAGRAGRTSEGHCYKLYSSAVYNDFSDFAKPEILCRPVEDICLILKTMGAPVVNFPYLTDPDPVQIRTGLKTLAQLGALAEAKKLGGITSGDKNKARENIQQIDTTLITPLGRCMASFPVAPRYAKMLALSGQFSLFPYTIAIVSALTVQEVLIEIPLDNTGQDDDKSNKWRSVRHKWLSTGDRSLLGDIMVLLSAVFEAHNNDNSRSYCEAYGLREKGLRTIRDLRHQLTYIVNESVPNCDIKIEYDMKLPNKEQCYALRQIILAGSVDRVACRVDASNLKTREDKQRWRNAYRTMDLEEPVYLPASSALNKQKEKPLWIVYQDIFESENGKMYMRGISVIEAEWLPRFAPTLSTISEPHANPPPFYDSDKDAVMCYADVTYGRADWSIPNCIVHHPNNKEYYSIFAFNLLKGKIIEGFAEYSHMLQDINFFLRPLALRLLEQREKFTTALMREKVTSRSRLMEIWREEPKYLLQEYYNWLSDPTDWRVISSAWPQLTTKT